MSHLELDEGQLWSFQPEVHLLPPDWTEPVVADWPGGVPLVLPPVLLMASDRHNDIGIYRIALLAVIWPENVLAREDLHSKTKERKVSSITRAVVGASLRLPSSQWTVCKYHLIKSLT